MTEPAASSALRGGGPADDRLPARTPRPARDLGERALCVAIDGPGSSGKSSVGIAVASVLGYRYIDTGLLYRAITWLALRRHVPLEDGPAVAALAPAVELVGDADGRLSRVRVGGVDVTRFVRSGAVDRRVSEAARQPAVRAALVGLQRTLVRDGGIVMVGRDIGTVVLPGADVKVYLDASPGERARRRALERGLDPDGPELAEILADLERRDAADAGRVVAPLRPAGDATIVDTDGMSFEAVVVRIVDLVHQASGDRAEAPR